MTLGGALQWAVLALCASMLLTHGALATGVLLARRRDRRGGAGRRAMPAPRISASSGHPSVSVVVAAMNEQEALPRLLESLAAQSTTAFELVLVDDRSSDATAAIMEQHRAAAPYPVRVVRNRRPPLDCTGKQQALDLGVAAAGGELLFFTDADCIVPPTWVECLAAYFARDRNHALGVVFGQLAVCSAAPERGGFLERYQAFEQPLVHQYSTGTAGLGTPTGCFGNNLALRAPVLARIGGFRSLGYTLTEDAALIGAASRDGWGVRVATLPATQIATEPQPTWRAFINQHVRWNGGAFFSSDRAAAWGYRYVTLFLILSVAAAPWALLAPWLAVLPVTSLLSIGTLATLAALLYRRRRPHALARVVPYTLFFMGFYAYITILAIVGVRTDWKGSRLAATHAPATPNTDAGSG